jgi:hypothetical protein
MFTNNFKMQFMKKGLFFILGAVLVGAGVLFSCQKTEVQDEGLILKGAVPKPTPTLILSYDPAPGLVGEEVTISAKVQYESADLTCGQVQLFYAVDANGDPCPVANAVNWVNPWGPPKDAPGGTFTTTYSAAGLYGWKTQYESSGSGCVYENLTGKDAVTMDIQIVDGCTVPLTITPFLVSANSDDGKLFKFTTQWKVKACADFSNLKTQGGLTAGSTVISTTPTASSIKPTKQNTIINWVQPTVAAGNEFIYTVVFTRTLKNPCTTYDITGAWSAKAWHWVDVTDPVTLVTTPTYMEYVAGYNNKIYYTTPCP